ncbi:hypothetical protein WT60_27100 [Burkholderia sp. MSMB617WGS]|uniref:Uncharacterized protein n=1 Tax=Burkholderia savannae TaxID=1637837 RepID=A0ABR5T670_9BURK|nr:hypothetical protein WS78_24940 [Burkholderia savannae]AOK50471.1 hypothetical protein WT60_27100 [Burkholderia sp. MSMB617WGS]KVG49715.1 hypothetical protein WS77_25875 [Burkholderia sp. MSMB0265]KVG82905.1 hypothetical protein WS81_08405 [Burkholderia sp. MSMB2040]KVG93503.1 hypothetical protein WS82_09890 [Burkholderia sp. MSMB2041]KVG97930.1 hypothetical protein WS83_30860 [Burkholderia sp. MSMB2042]KVK87221.1 hypothetical protein WS91_31145 [Burkholderia sp. MSMB1498]
MTPYRHARQWGVAPSQRASTRHCGMKVHHVAFGRFRCAHSVAPAIRLAVAFEDITIGNANHA